MSVICRLSKVIQLASILSALMFSMFASANFQPLKMFGDNPGELSASYFKSV